MPHVSTTIHHRARRSQNRHSTSRSAGFCGLASGATGRRSETPASISRLLVRRDRNRLRARTCWPRTSCDLSGPMAGRGRLVIRLERLTKRRHQQDSCPLETFGDLEKRVQVTTMNGVERPSQDPDPSLHPASDLRRSSASRFTRSFSRKRSSRIPSPVTEENSQYSSPSSSARSRSAFALPSLAESTLDPPIMRRVRARSGE